MYEGQFDNGVKSGFGRYIWADGKFYVGQWSNNQQNGLGSMVLQNGVKI